MVALLRIAQALAPKSSIFACFGIRHVACLPFLIRVPMSSHIAINPRTFSLSLPSYTHSHTLTLFLHPRRSFLCPFTRCHDAMDTDANCLKNRLSATCSQGAHPCALCLLCPSPLHPCRIANIAHPFEAVKSLRTHRPPQPRHPLSLARAWLHLIVL